MWRKHCMGQSGIEEVTGLPCSLIDLLASPMDFDIEERLLRWPGKPNEPMMCKLWEATQYAGLIMIREFRLNQGLPRSPDTQPPASKVQHILSILQVLRSRMDDSTFEATEMLLFPLVAAGSQSTMLTTGNRSFLRECIVTLSGNSLSSYPYYQAVVRALETLWASDGSKSLDRVTRELGLELALF
jgi:hypothetical protein